MIEKIKEFAKNKNNLFVLILVGVLLMVISLPVKKGGILSAGDGSGSTEVGDAAETWGSAEAGRMTAAETDYIEATEKKLAELLSRVEGAGKVEVIITLRTSTERIVEKDMPILRSNTSEEDSEGGSRNVNSLDEGESTVFSTDGNASEPYVVKTISPEVEGVLILAEGAGNGFVSKNLSDAAQVLFGIEAHRVKVMKMEAAK